MRTIIIVSALLLSSCSSVGPTTEQMQAMSALQSSLCINGASWNGGPLSVHYVSFGGRSTGTAGGGGKATCGSSAAEFNNEGKAPTLPKVTTTTTTTKED